MRGYVIESNGLYRNEKVCLIDILHFTQATFFLHGLCMNDIRVLMPIIYTDPHLLERT